MADVTVISDQQDAGLARSEGELRLIRAAVEHVYDSVMITTAVFDKPGPRIVYVNPAFTKLTGYTAQEVIGKTPRILQGPWASRAVLDRLRRNLSAGEPFVGEAVNHRKDGSQFLLQWRINPVHDASGKITHWVAIQGDITDRHRAEQHLAEQEYRYRTISQLTSDYVYSAKIAPDGQIVAEWVTDAFRRITGYSLEEFEASGGWLTAVHPDDLQNLLQSVQQVLANRTTASEYRLRTKGGQMRWLRDSVQPIWDNEQQRVTRILGAVQDITEQRQAEEALRKSEQLHEEAQRIAQLGHWESDFVSGEVIWSDQTYRILGMDLGSVQPSRELYLSHVHPADKQLVKNVCEAALSRQEPFDIEHRIVRADGVTREVHSTCQARFDKAGKAIGLFGTFHDITERKQAEQALKKVHGELEIRVKQRTAELEESNEQLRREITERKRAEEALRVIQYSIDHAADAVFWLGPDAHFTYVNEAASRMLGYTREELLGLTVHDIDPNFPPDTWLDRWRMTKEQGTSTFQSTHKTKDGKIFPVEITVDHLNFEGQEYHCTFARDITERKQAEAALIESEQRYRALVENAPEAIVVHDVDTGVFVDVNQNAVEMFGLDRQSLLKIGPADVSPPEQPDGRPSGPLVREMTARALAGETPVFEWTFVDVHGKQIPCEVRLARLPSAGRKLIRGSITDITERKQAQAALQSRASQQAAVAELGQYALAELSLETLFDEAVSRTARTLGVEFCKVLELLPKQDLLLLRAGVGWKEGLVGRATVGTDKNSQASYTLQTNDLVIVKDLAAETRFNGPPLLAEHHVVSGMSVVIQGHDGPWGVLGVHTTRQRDFTPDDGNFLKAVANVLAEVINRKQVEARSRQHLAELAHMARLNTMGEMVTGVAHELNQPLSAIANLAFAGEQALPPSSASPADRLPRLLKDIKFQAHRSGEIIRRLRRLVRKTEPQTVPVDVNQLVLETVEMVEHDIRMSNTQVDLKLDDSAAHILADPIQIQQVILNLVRNALEAAAESAIQPSRLGIETLCQNGNRVHVRVQDTGKGLPEDNPQQVFDAFFTTKPEGMGLGLAISRSIIENHGGRLWATPNPHGGAVFQFALPIAKTGKPEP